MNEQQRNNLIRWYRAPGPDMLASRLAILLATDAELDGARMREVRNFFLEELRVMLGSEIVAFCNEMSARALAMMEMSKENT